MLVLSVLIPLALSIIGIALLEGVIVIEVSRETLGEKRKLGELWRQAGRRFWPLTLWILLESAALMIALSVIVGIILLLAPLGPVGIIFAVIAGFVLGLGLLVVGVWVGMKVSLVPCAIVLEGLGVRPAIARSWRLTNGYFWKTFGVQILVYFIVQTAAQFVLTPLGLLFGLGTSLLDPNGAVQEDSIVFFIVGEGIFLLFSIVFGAIAMVVQAGVVAVIYLDLRIRKEGLDIELIRFVEERQTGRAGADPFQAKGQK
jgi:hypothetical protein